MDIEQLEFTPITSCKFPVTELMEETINNEVVNRIQGANAQPSQSGVMIQRITARCNKSTDICSFNNC